MLFSLPLVTGNKEMQDIAIKATKAAEKELIQATQQSYITCSYFLWVDVLNTYNVSVAFM